ncbi:Ribonuclease III family protein [Hirschfeldia incana]|nr:Ribonuclease III family protein [Hirschfeldia incana]
MSMVSAAAASSSSLVRAALDTRPKLRYNPNSPRNVKKIPNSTSFVPPPPSSSSPAIVSTTGTSVSDLLKRPTSKDVGDDCVGSFEKWFPSPPKVDKPRSVYNAASLAYIGDSIYEIYARRHFLFPPLSIEEYNDRVQAVVRCEAQYALLQKLVDEDFLTKDEREILRWGKNVGSVKTRSTRRAGVAVYNKASSLETLIGYLYLANGKRLEEIMQKLGFSSGSSTEIMVKEAKHKLSALK